jgi:hypothetical protein
LDGTISRFNKVFPLDKEKGFILKLNYFITDLLVQGEKISKLSKQLVINNG